MKEKITQYIKDNVFIIFISRNFYNFNYEYEIFMDTETVHKNNYKYICVNVDKQFFKSIKKLSRLMRLAWTSLFS